MAETATPEAAPVQKKRKPPANSAAPKLKTSGPRVVKCIVTGVDILYSGRGRPPLYSPAVAKAKGRERSQIHRLKAREAKMVAKVEQTKALTDALASKGA